MKRKLEGKPKTKGFRSDLKPIPQSGIGWKQEDTAKDLNISQQAVSKSIQIAIAIEETPELAKEKKGSVILRKIE